MRVERAPSYPVSIFIAGNYDLATAICSQFCNDVGLCVTVAPTRYVFTGGAEEGVVVGLINYPRFPKAPSAILDDAQGLARHLREGLGQESYSIQTPDETLWHSWRKDDLPAGYERCSACGWVLDYSCRPPCNCEAQVDRSPEGQDAKQLDRNDESAVAESDAPESSSGSGVVEEG